MLPFEASGTDSTLENFALWLPDDLSVALQKMKVLDKIPAWSLSQTYADAKPADIARELGVQGLVQGRIRSEGEEISINLELYRRQIQ